MTSPDSNRRARLEREIERERAQRHMNDDAKTDGPSDDDLRLKDARENASSGKLQRHRER